MVDQRPGYESFDCIPALRLDAHEQLTKLRMDTISARLDRIEEMIERLEKRVWLAVFGVAAALTTEVFLNLIHITQ